MSLTLLNRTVLEFVTCFVLVGSVTPRLASAVPDQRPIQHKDPKEEEAAGDGPRPRRPSATPLRPGGHVILCPWCTITLASCSAREAKYFDANWNTKESRLSADYTRAASRALAS